MTTAAASITLLSQYMATGLDGAQASGAPLTAPLLLERQTITLFTAVR